MSVEHVRTILGVDSTDARATFTDRALFATWGAVAMIVFLAPLLVLLLAIWAVVHALSPH
jgi:uncharacterized membrane protein